MNNDPCSELRFRISVMIAHISKHNSFDKQELVKLLKDANQMLRRQSKDIDFARKQFDDIANGLEQLADSPILRKQA